MFAQRHFIKIAATINSLSLSKSDRDQIIERFADVLEADNPRFKRQVFEDACWCFCTEILSPSQQAEKREFEATFERLGAEPGVTTIRLDELRLDEQQAEELRQIELEELRQIELEQRERSTQ